METQERCHLKGTSVSMKLQFTDQGKRERRKEGKKRGRKMEKGKERGKEGNVRGDGSFKHCMIW